VGQNFLDTSKWYPRAGGEEWAASRSVASTRSCEVVLRVLKGEMTQVEAARRLAWTFSSPVGATGGITAYGGVNISTPVVTHGGLYSANTRLIAAPSITTSVDGALVIAL
jgi:hypothetical protein